MLITVIFAFEFKLFVYDIFSPNDNGKCPMVAREKPPIEFALPTGTKNMSVKNTLS